MPVVSFNCGHCKRACERMWKPSLPRPRFCDALCARRARPPKALARIFLQKVHKTDGCWLWTGKKVGRGYGGLRVNERDLLAHRVSYELHVGPIPDGQWVLHRCDNPPCVNPEHLFLGDRRANFDDMLAKGRSLRGERHLFAKLTSEQVVEIRRRARFEPQSKLAAEFGMSRATICNIIKRKTWRHVA